jgi:cytochrome P450
MAIVPLPTSVTAVLQVAVVATLTWIGLAWLRRTIATAKMPKFIPISELSPVEILLYPIFGHATIFSDEDKMNALAKKYGGKDGIVSFYLFFQPGVWWVKPDFTKEVLGLPGAENPDIAKIAANHGRHNISRYYSGVFDAPSSTDLFKRHRQYFHQNLVSGTMLRRTHSFLKEEILNCLKRLESKNGQPVDPHAIINLVPLNYLLRILLGTKFDGDVDSIELKEPKPGMPVTPAHLIFLTEQMNTVFFATSLGALFSWLWYVDPVCQTAVRNKQLLDGCADAMMKQCRAGALPDAIVMQDIISRSDKGEMTQVDFYKLLYVMLGGGVDAVSITTTCILQRMVDYPNVQKKVQAEIDAVVPTDRAVLVDDLDKLAFFWATVKETMRTSKMSSAVVIRSNSAPIRWRGYIIPTDTFLLLPLLSSLEDGGTFDPNRHVANPMPNITGTTDVMNTMWGGGPRICPGGQLAKQELGMMVANILKHFSVQAATSDGQKVWKNVNPNSFARRPHHVLLKFVPRLGTVNVEDLVGLREE